MIDLNLIKAILWPDQPTFPGSFSVEHEELLAEGLTMGTLYIGRQGTGKTTSLARHLVDYFKAYPDRAIFVLDWSGSISDNILSLVLKEPQDVQEKLIRRLVYDELGNPEWVIPMPEFSNTYGGNFEEQVLYVLKPIWTQGGPNLWRLFAT